MTAKRSDSKLNILVTGATGYVGQRLVPQLLLRGHKVRCMVRDPSNFFPEFLNKVQMVTADALDQKSLAAALEDIDVAFYLIHSLKSGHGKFVKLDIQAAENFGKVAKEKNIKRIIFLGGLGSEYDKLSPHLKSRHDTGKILRSSGVPVTEFRSGSIIGSGSLAFEMLRYLTERLPVMFCPIWVNTLTHPIAIRDVLRYLVKTITMPETIGQTYEIGGEDIISYRDMIKTYARIRGYRRLIINIPILTPMLSSFWIGLVTPIPSNIAHSLIEGLKNEIFCRDYTARKVFAFRPINLEKAIRLALRKSKHWVFDTDSIPNLLERKFKSKGKREIIHSRGYIVEKRIRMTYAPADILFSIIKRLGGKNGWLYANWLWQLRFFLDRIFGGVAQQKRRNEIDLREGDPVDFWGVERLIENNLLRLHCVDMMLPGEAWLQFKIKPLRSGANELTMTAFLQPKGLAGIAYWYGSYPLHRLIFKGTVNRVVELAEKITDEQEIPKGNVIPPA